MPHLCFPLVYSAAAVEKKERDFCRKKRQIGHKKANQGKRSEKRPVAKKLKKRETAHSGEK